MGRGAPASSATASIASTSAVAAAARSRSSTRSVGESSPISVATDAVEAVCHSRSESQRRRPRRSSRARSTGEPPSSEPSSGPASPAASCCPTASGSPSGGASAGLKLPISARRCSECSGEPGGALSRLSSRPRAGVAEEEAVRCRARASIRCSRARMSDTVSSRDVAGASCSAAPPPMRGSGSGSGSSPQLGSAKSRSEASAAAYSIPGRRAAVLRPSLPSEPRYDGATARPAEASIANGAAAPSRQRELLP